jgi:glycosyltransferase involved in cell wall biosynthesis
MQISVVVPLYNKAPTLVRTLDSVLNQIGVEVDVVVVDDSSTDDSVRVAASYESRIRLVRQENAGPSAARNRGARLARYPLILFLDADDALAPGALAAHAQAHAKLPMAGVSVGSFRLHKLDGSTQEEQLDRRDVRFMATDDVLQASGLASKLVIFVPPGAVCITRELFDRIGGFDESLRSWEITDFMLRAGLESPGFAVLAQICANIYQTPGSASTITHKQVVYMARYCEKALALMPRVPNTEQPALLLGLKSFMETMWNMGAIREFKALARGLCPLLIHHGIRSKPCTYSAMPTIGLKAIASARAVMRQAI